MTKSTTKGKYKPEALREQDLPIRSKKIAKWEDVFWRYADLRELWDNSPNTPELSKFIQRRISDYTDRMNDAIRAMIELIVPEAKDADKTIPAELLKLRQAIGEMTLGAWNAAVKRTGAM